MTKSPDHESDPLEEINRLHSKLEEKDTPDPADIKRLQWLLTNNHGVITVGHGMMECIRRSIVKRVSTRSRRACLYAELDILRKDLEAPSSTPLEQLLIDLILTTHLRLICAEASHLGNAMNPPMSLQRSAYFEKLLSVNHSRYLRLIESLARLRRTLRSRPALKINLATHGGQQVNL